MALRSTVPVRGSREDGEGRAHEAHGPRPFSLLLLVVLLVSSLAAPLPAQSPFTFRIGRGELGVQGQGSIPCVGTRTGTDETFGQWLRLPVDGHLLHPRVLRYMVTVSPRFTQHRVSSLDGDSRTRDLGTDVTLQLFQGRRLSFNLQNVRSSGRSDGAFGSTGDFRSSSSTATFWSTSRLGA